MQTSIKKYDLIVLGGSAGSVDVLFQIIPALPKSFSYAFAIVIHRKSNDNSSLPELLQQLSTIRVQEAGEKEKITSGTVYIAPVDYHLLIENNHTFSLDFSPKVNHSRPSIDVFFKSAADIYKGKVIGIIITGANEDGATGLAEIKKMGGLAIVQDPESACISTMPLAAIQKTQVDHVLSVDGIIKFLKELT